MTEEQGICDFIKAYLSSALPDAGIDPSQANIIISDLDMGLRDTYGGDRTYVPSTSGLTKQQRNTAIIKAWKSGADRGRIAVKFNVHRSTVDRVISGHLSSRSRACGFGSDEWNL